MSSLKKRSAIVRSETLTVAGETNMLGEGKLLAGAGRNHNFFVLEGLQTLYHRRIWKIMFIKGENAKRR